jgi:3-oxoacyl-[acyl-carrier protein] reductase
MELGLRSRVAIVLAASRGLGKATAVSLAQEGAHVVICSRQKNRLEDAANTIRSSAQSGVEVVPVVADLAKAGRVERVVAAAIRRFGRIDILVTNAGGPPVASFEDVGDRVWQKGFELNLLSTIRAIRAVLPHMRRRHWGRIVNITSVVARQPAEDLVLSSTVRPGVIGLAKVLANTYARDGILVNNVAPGYILTDRQKEIFAARGKGFGMSKQQYFEEVARWIPVGRLGTPEELADVIVFLCSERAGYVNGVTIGVDGGFAKGLM